MRSVRIICLSHMDFDDRMADIGLNDDNVDNEKDKAFISIIGTEECLRHYLNEEDTAHYFSDGHGNVLNLDFDDLENDYVYQGHVFKAMSEKQAEKTIDFIEDNIGVSEYNVHCRAGKSRSRACCEMIARILENNGITVDYPERDKYASVLNAGVLNKLSRAYYKKHGMYGKDENE